jgi:hypothetical protein
MKLKLTIRYWASLVITLIIIYYVINDATNFEFQLYLNFFNHFSFATSFSLGYLVFRFYCKRAPNTRYTRNDRSGNEAWDEKYYQGQLLKYGAFVIPITWIFLAGIFTCFGTFVFGFDLKELQTLTAIPLLAGLLVYVLTGFLFGFTITPELLKNTQKGKAVG